MSSMRFTVILLTFLLCVAVLTKRFSAQVAKLNTHGKVSSLHDSLLEMVLLAGSSVDDSQRIPVLSSMGGPERATMEQNNY